jgi:ribonuclease HI
MYHNLNLFVAGVASNTELLGGYGFLLIDDNSRMKAEGYGTIDQYRSSLMFATAGELLAVSKGLNSANSIGTEAVTVYYNHNETKHWVINRYEALPPIKQARNYKRFVQEKLEDGLAIKFEIAIPEKFEASWSLVQRYADLALAEKQETFQRLD